MNYFSDNTKNCKDYYAFGSLMPGRSFNPSDYRFGFNGKEKDDEWTGSVGVTYDYGFRIYDSRIARFLSVDPISSSYPMLTPYQFASNTPIMAVDLDGLEAKVVVHRFEDGKEGIQTKTYDWAIVASKMNKTGNSLYPKYSGDQGLGNLHVWLSSDNTIIGEVLYEPVFGKEWAQRLTDKFQYNMLTDEIDIPYVEDAPSVEDIFDFLEGMQDPDISSIENEPKSNTEKSATKSKDVDKVIKIDTTYQDIWETNESKTYDEFMTITKKYESGKSESKTERNEAPTK